MQHQNHSEVLHDRGFFFIYLLIYEDDFDLDVLFPFSCFDVVVLNCNLI